MMGKKYANLVPVVLMAVIAAFSAYGVFLFVRGHTVQTPGQGMESASSGEIPGNPEPDRDNADGFWRIAAPGATGTDPTAVRAYLELCRLTGADAALVVRKGRIIGEMYSRRYRGEQSAMSSTKSVTGLLTGIMRDRNLLGPDDTVGKFVPSWRSGIRSGVTVRHLLTMTSGLLRTDKSEESVGFSARKNDFVVALTPGAVPGTEWSYSNEGVQLLSPVLEAASGERLDAFALKNLFEPLGMAHTRMRVSGSAKDVWTYADMITTPRDFARIGMLVLNGGTFAGRRIISSSYLAESFNPVEKNQGYGYLWWLENNPARMIVSRGYLSTDMYVFPDHDLVVVRMQEPVAAFSGLDESRPYQDYERQFLGMLIGEAPTRPAGTILSRLREVPGTAGSIVPAPGDSALQAPWDGVQDSVRSGIVSADSEKILEEAIRLSANGETGRVLELLQPLEDDESIPAGTRAKIFHCIALQYIRLGDLRRAERYLDRSGENGIERIGGYWTGSYHELRTMVGKP